MDRESQACELYIVGIQIVMQSICLQIASYIVASYVTELCNIFNIIHIILVHIAAAKVLTCPDMANYLTKNIAMLSNLSYNNMKLHLMANDVITRDERQRIDKMDTSTAQMTEVIDIVQNSLFANTTTKYKGLLASMEKSSDVLLNDKAKELSKLTNGS